VLTIHRHRRWLYPILVLALLAPFTPTLDLWVSSQFYNSSTKTFTNNRIFEFIFDYAQLPAFALAGLASVLFSISYFTDRWKESRILYLTIILAMLIGPGLIINGILKPGWGRARPRQIEAFGGSSPFSPFYKPNLNPPSGDKYKSMPSGHASMGFYFLVLTVLGYRTKRKILFFSGLFLALSLGLGLGYTRIAQGGHYLTDVIVAALISWLVAIALDWFFFENEKAYPPTV